VDEVVGEAVCEVVGRSSLYYTELTFDPSFQLVKNWFWSPDISRATPSICDLAINPLHLQCTPQYYLNKNSIGIDL
jgi:hypothetical protein